MKLGTETNSVVNAILAQSAPEPKIGDGATLLHWTDRTACTVIAYDGKVLTVQTDKATRSDSNGMSENQTYSYERWPEGPTSTFMRDRRGAWRPCLLNSRGRWVLTTGVGLSVGSRRQYHDFSF